jgi:hypothetical protein
LQSVKKCLFIYIVFIFLAIPTSAFATNHSYSSSKDETFWSLVNNMLNFFKRDTAESNANYGTENHLNTNKYYSEKNDEHRQYIEGKKINNKDWEKYFKKKKHPANCEKDSRDIWRKWFCYDDGWDDECDEWDYGDDHYKKKNEWWKNWH